MRVLVLGGRGFLGRHVVDALVSRGHAVTIGSRYGQGGSPSLPIRRLRLERCLRPVDFAAILADIDAVVNCVGILRERGQETYARVHRLAPAALAAACRARRVRLVHVSALGLDTRARSGFIRSKIAGEDAIAASGADHTIVRPSLLEGEGGFGARWIRALARCPVHAVPADAVGRIAALDVRDAGFAIARLVELAGRDHRVVELGGMEPRTMAGHLAALRAGAGRDAVVVRIPAWLARVAAHACDLLHVSPFSFGHLELLRHDNVPQRNLLPWLLGAPPRRVGAARPVANPAGVSARGRATLRASAVLDGGSTPTAPTR